jgi:hypothetical protein
MKKLYHNYNYRNWAALIVLALFFFVGVQNHEAKAQGQASRTGGWIYDPLKMPDVWKKLMLTPLDSSLWVEYYGRNWSQMEIRDLERINFWKQQLMLRILSNNESIIGFVIRPEFRSVDFFIDEMAFVEMLEEVEKVKKEAQNKKGVQSPVVRAKIAGMEALILQENEELRRLKANPRANFALIESIYEDIFREFKMEYVYYDQKHPDKKYPLTKWVEDQDKILQDIKMKQVEEIRKKYEN